MGFKIVSSFDIAAPIPVDGRLVCQNLSDIPEDVLYEGMLVYQRSNKKFYKREDGIYKTLAEALGVSMFNDRSGDVYIVPGQGISISEQGEVDSGRFEISTTGVLLTNGTIPMDNGYSPTLQRHVVTKLYADTLMATHEQKKATNLISGHTKIDNVSIKENQDEQIYVDCVNGGDF